MSAATGALLGATGGVGALLAVRGLPALNRPRLDARLAPYVRDASTASRLLANEPRTPFPTLERLLRPTIADAAALVERWLGGSASVRRRLEQAGSDATVEDFRAEQVVWGALGLAAGVALSLLLLARGAVASPLPLLVLCLIAAVLGVLARDRALTRQVVRREARMLAELPTVAELLALAVSAGEGAVGALERVSKVARGELAVEISRALADARAGAPLVRALESLAARTSLPALARFVDGIVIAVERGTPLADVLRAQAVDVREAGKRALLEAGGRKEIAMMIPVVFLVLPVTVVFALFPGFYGLSLSSP